MSVYGGFDPGTFQPWSLNIVQKSLGQAGIGYGMQVTPASPASMNVVVTTDSASSDAVCFLPNGAWLRIDANVTLSVPSNAGGSTRIDAVTAYVDPTGTTAAGLYYVTSWNGGFAPSGNVLPLAIVSVPNGAAAIAASNIVETELLANAGGGSPLHPDAVVGDSSNTYCQPGIFAEYNLVLTASALSNQTSFSVALTQLQRLVPQGRIGGTQEIGFFAGPKGWYTPRVFGSVSGELPLTSVDAVGGAFNTSQGAQAGETIYASFKYYDFGQDLQALGGVRFIAVDSPYCVYQGEVTPGVLNASAPLFPGGKSIQLDASEAVYVTSYLGAYVAVLYAVNQTSVKYSTWANGTSVVSNVTAEYNSGLSPYTLASGLYPSNGSQVNVYELLCTQGTLEFGGAATGNFPGASASYYQDGGELTVNGRTIALNSSSTNVFGSYGTSVPANGLLSGYSYVDQHGNLSYTVAPQAAERFAGRVPVANALAYGGTLQKSSPSYGVYAAAEMPFQTEPIHLGVSNTSDGGLNGWSITQDVTSPYGVSLVSSTTNDMFMVRGYLSGLDIVASATATTRFTVNALGISTYTYWVQPTAGYVSLTVVTSLPPTQNSILLTIASPSSNFALAAVDLRYPASTPPTLGATPLAELFLSGAAIRRAGLQDSLGISITAPRAGSATWGSSVVTGWGGQVLSLDNKSTEQSVNLATVGNSAARLVFVGGPSTGKALVQVGSWTATIDTYNATTQLLTSVWSSASFNQWTSMTVSSLGTKNNSSGGTTLMLAGVDTLQHPLHVKDVRPWSNDGYHPSALGNSLLSFLGQPTPSQYGIGADHLQDRGVTSRKMRPLWSQVVTKTAFSGFTNGTNVFDPYLVTSITVDVPSVLLISLVAPVSLGGSGIGAQGGIALDGNIHPLVNVAVQNQAAGTDVRMFNNLDMVVVGPGAHTCQLSLSGFGSSTQPYFDSTYSRSLTVVAFAL